MCSVQCFNMVGDINLHSDAREPVNSENQNNFEDVAVKIEKEDEEEEEIIGQNLPHFSYTLDLSFNQKPAEEVLCGVKNTHTVKPCLKYVKLKSDHSIETNSETPWALAKKSFPRSLERILAHCSVKANKKIRNKNVSITNNNSQLCAESVNPPLEATTYSNFRKSNQIWNSTINSGVSNMEASSTCNKQNEKVLVHEIDSPFELLCKQHAFSKNTTEAKPSSELKVRKKISTQKPSENMPLGENIGYMFKKSKIGNNEREFGIEQRNSLSNNLDLNTATDYNDQDQNTEYPKKKKLKDKKLKPQKDILDLVEFNKRDAQSTNDKVEEEHELSMHIKKHKHLEIPKKVCSSSKKNNTKYECNTGTENFSEQCKKNKKHKKLDESISTIDHSELINLNEDQINIEQQTSCNIKKNDEKRKKQKISEQRIEEQNTTPIDNTEFLKLTKGVRQDVSQNRDFHELPGDNMVKKKVKIRSKEFEESINEKENETRKSKKTVDIDQSEVIRVIEEQNNYTTPIDNTEFLKLTKGVGQDVSQDRDFHELPGDNMVKKKVKIRSKEFEESINEKENETRKSKKKSKKTVDIDQSEVISLTKDQVNANKIQSGCNELNSSSNKIKKKKKRKFDEQINLNIPLDNTEFLKLPEVVELPEIIKKKKKNILKDSEQDINENEHITRKSEKKRKHKEKSITDVDQNNLINLTDNQPNVEKIHNVYNEMNLNNVKVKKRKKHNILVQKEEEINHKTPFDNTDILNAAVTEFSGEPICKKNRGKKRLKELLETIEGNETITTQIDGQKKQKELEECIAYIDAIIHLTKDQVNVENLESGCNEVSLNHEKYNQRKKRTIVLDNREIHEIMEVTDLSEEHTLKKKKKIKLGGSIEDDTFKDQNNIVEENCTYAEYRKRKRKKSCQVSTENENTCSDNEEEELPNIISENFMNSDNEPCMTEDICEKRSEYIYADKLNSTNNTSKHEAAEFFNSDKKMKTKKKSKKVSDGDLNICAYEDKSLNNELTEIEAEYVLDIDNEKKRKKKKRPRLNSDDTPIDKSEYKKHVMSEDDTTKGTKKTSSKIGKEKHKTFVEENENILFDKETKKSSEIKQKTKKVLHNLENMDETNIEKQANPEKKTISKEREKSKKDRHKKHVVCQDDQVLDREEIRLDKCKLGINITDTAVLNSHNNEIALGVRKKRNEKNAINLDKKISDLLSAKVELLFKDSAFDKLNNEENKVTKKCSKIKIVDSTVNININAEIKQKKRSENRSNTGEDENNKQDKSEKATSHKDLLDEKRTQKFSNTNQDIVNSNCGNEQVVTKLVKCGEKIATKTLKELYNTNINSAELAQNKITRFENGKDMSFIEVDSDFDDKTGENKSVSGILRARQEKSIMISGSEKNIFTTELEKKQKDEISNTYIITNKVKKNNANSSCADIFPIDLLDLTSDSDTSSKTLSAEDKNRRHSKLGKEVDHIKQIDDGEALSSNDDIRPKEIFIKNNYIPVAEIDLDSDVQSEFDDNECMRNLKSNAAKEWNRVNHFEHNNDKKETKNQNSLLTKMTTRESIQTKTNNRESFEAYSIKPDQKEECDISAPSNVADVSYISEKRKSKRTMRKQPTEQRREKKNSNIAKTVAIEDEENIFSGIFKKEVYIKETTEMDVAENGFIGQKIDNHILTSPDKFTPTERAAPLYLKDDSSNEISENRGSKNNNNRTQLKIENDSNNSFSFSDILAQSNSDRLLSNSKNYSQEVYDTEIDSKSNITEESCFSVKSETLNERVTSQTKKKSVEPPNDDLAHFQYKQRTLNNFPNRQEDLEEKKKKQKVIEMLNQSKSIQEIEEALEIPNVDEDRAKVQELFIELPWPIPPIHKIAFYVSGCPSERQKKALKDAGITVKLGKYTKDEDKRIIQNWLEFCKCHNWDKDYYLPFLKVSVKSGAGVLHKYQRKKFAQFISHGFDRRLMYSVYHRFRRIFSQKELENGRFTDEDDKIIEEYLRVTKSERPFADLVNILKRSRLAIQKRYTLIKAKKTTSNEQFRWDKVLTERLLANLIEVTCSVNLSELKDRPITSQEWSKVSKNLNIPIHKLRRTWIFCFHPRLFSPNNYKHDLATVKKELVDLLYVRYNDWREIDWTEVAKEFDNGFTNAKLCKIIRDLLTSRVPPKIRNDLHNALKYLRKHHQDWNFKSTDKFKFVKEILKETKNGTIIPKVVNKEVPKEKPRTERRIEEVEELDELFSE